MPPQGRLGDNAFVPPHPHGTPVCPLPGKGPAVTGSFTVKVNNRPALKVNDMGVHSGPVCPGPNIWKASQGSATVKIDNQPAHRLGDQTEHCGGAGMGTLIEGSSDVIVGG